MIDAADAVAGVADSADADVFAQATDACAANADADDLYIYFPIYTDNQIKKRLYCNLTYCRFVHSFSRP